MRNSINVLKILNTFNETSKQYMVNNNEKSTVMIVAYTKNTKEYAKILSDSDIFIVEYSKANFFNALIYKSEPNPHLLSSLHTNCPVLFLDVTNIAPSDAKDMLKSGLYSRLF